MSSNVVDDRDVVALGVTRRGPFTKANETDDSQHKMKLLYNSMFVVIEIVLMRNGCATHRLHKVFSVHASVDLPAGASRRREGIRNVRETDATMIAWTI